MYSTNFFDNYIKKPTKRTFANTVLPVVFLIVFFLGITINVKKLEEMSMLKEQIEKEEERYNKLISKNSNLSEKINLENTLLEIKRINTFFDKLPIDDNTISYKELLAVNKSITENLFLREVQFKQEESFIIGNALEMDAIANLQNNLRQSKAFNSLFLNHLNKNEKIGGNDFQIFFELGGETKWVWSKKGL